MRKLDMPFKEVTKEEMDHLADALFEGAIFTSRTRFLRILPMTITIARLSTKKRWGVKVGFTWEKRTNVRR